MPKFELMIKPGYEDKRDLYFSYVSKFYDQLLNRQPDFEKNLSGPLVFVFGGDGTLLKAINTYLDKEASFVLIKGLGTLGHYAEFDQAEELLNFDFSKLVISKERHKFLKIEFAGQEYYAINEFLLSNPYQTLKFSLKVGDEELCEYAASGICISTPFGSTAYNHSLGGAIIFNNLGYEFNVLAPIENNVYHSGITSLYLDDKEILEITFNNDSEIYLAPDMKVIEFDQSIKKFVIRKSSKEFSLMHFTKFSPCLRLRESFVWNKKKIKEE